MVHTVGITGVNGAVGAPTAKLLAESAEQGKIKLVILHRAGSSPKGFENARNVELRTIDISQPSAELDNAVKGINVMITAIGSMAVGDEPNLIEAISKSPDLVTYIPSLYSTTWTQRDKEDEILGPIVKFFHLSLEKAAERQIGVTTVYTGAFAHLFFAHGFVGAPIKENTVWANETQMRHKVPITTMHHLAQSLADLATSDPQTIKNTSHTVVTFWPTGQELAELYTKINGKPATLKDFTEKDREELRADAANFGAVKVGYFDHWANNDWEYPSSTLPYIGPSMQEVARDYA